MVTLLLPKQTTRVRFPLPASKNPDALKKAPVFLFVRRACPCSVVKVHRGVVADELKSDLQGSHREMWARGSNSEIVA